jgi:hypothetical protein
MSAKLLNIRVFSLNMGLEVHINRSRGSLIRIGSLQTTLTQSEGPVSKKGTAHYRK